MARERGPNTDHCWPHRTADLVCVLAPMTDHGARRRRRVFDVCRGAPDRGDIRVVVTAVRSGGRAAITGVSGDLSPRERVAHSGDVHSRVTDGGTRPRP